LVPVTLLSRQGYHHFQNPVLKSGACLFGFGSFRQRDGSVEPSIATLSSVHAAPVFFVFIFALALDDQSIVGDFHLDVLRL
jgi:hypothetical protein